MGSDRISKKRRSSSPQQDEEGKKKRHRSSDKESYHNKSRKSSSSSTAKDGKSEKRKDKSKHHKHERREISNFKELTDADYFLKNNEFCTWLKDEKDTFFSDLSSESARKLFAKFVKRWNDKKLDSKYYDGIVTAQRSSHNWKIKTDNKGSPQRRRGSNRDI